MESEQDQGPTPPSERARQAREELFGQDYTTVEAAYILGFDDTATVLKYRRDGLLPGYQIGREYRFPKSTLEQFRQHLLQEQEQEARKTIIEREAERRYRHSQERGDDNVRLMKCSDCGTRISVTTADEHDSQYLEDHQYHPLQRGQRIWMDKCPFCKAYPQVYHETKEEVGERVRAEYLIRSQAGNEEVLRLVACPKCGTTAMAHEQSFVEAMEGIDWPSDLRIDCEYCGQESYMSSKSAHLQGEERV